MLTTEEIILTLDYSNAQSVYSNFIELGHPYVYLIDCRLNIFREDNYEWAIVAERLGFTERGGGIELEISYFGNCLHSLESYNGGVINHYSILPVNDDSFTNSVDDIGFCLKPDAKHWIVGDQKVNLSTNKQDYIDNDIELKEYEPGEISVEEAARLAIVNDSDAFRATDEQLYKCIPADLKKILVLNEWFHKDFSMQSAPPISPGQLLAAYELNKEHGASGITFAEFSSLVKQKEAQMSDYDRKEWEENRPGTYETWQQLAQVIVTGDVSFYKPTLPPNTHWTNWPESGTL